MFKTVCILLASYLVSGICFSSIFNLRILYLYEWNDPGLCVSFTLLLLLLRNICCNLEIICNPTNHLEQYILLLLVHHNRRWNHSPSRKILFGRGHGIKSTFVVSNGAVAIDVVAAVAAAVGVALLCCWWYLTAKLLFSLPSVAPCTALAGGGPRMHLDKEMIEFWLHWLRCARRWSREGHGSSSAAFRAAFQVENFNVSTAVKIHCLVSGLLAACCLRRSLRPSHPGCSSVWSHSIQT